MEQGSNTTPSNTDGQQTKSDYQLAMDAVSVAQRADDGTLTLQDGLPKDVQAIANLEVSRRESQAGFTRGQQSLAKVQAENKVLLDQGVKTSLTQEQSDNLEDLKISDPDAWFVEKTKLDEAAKATQRETLHSASQEAGTNFELQRREKVLQDFSQNTGFTLTADIIANDVPPRLQQKLKDGMEFGAWLYEVKVYLDTPKVVENQTVTNVTDIGTGGSGAGETAGNPAAYGNATIY